MIDLFTKEMIEKCQLSWRDLDGKTLKIKVIETEGWKFIYGIDMATNKIYLIDQYKIK